MCVCVRVLFCSAILHGKILTNKYSELYVFFIPSCLKFVNSIIAE